MSAPGTVSASSSMVAAAVAYIALGANLDDPVAQVQTAIKSLSALPQSELIQASSLYLTAPQGLLEQPDFVNAVVALRTTLSPQQLLHALLEEEQRQGRIRSIHNGPRTLDLDLLLYGDLVMHTPELTVPHPRLHLRAFTLAPLAEIAPDLAIPGRGTLSAWLPSVTYQNIHRLPC